ncbi:hypothetical protein AHAS_Ahas18G0293800 [Arachis hypogaea]
MKLRTHTNKKTADEKDDCDQGKGGADGKAARNMNTDKKRANSRKYAGKRKKHSWPNFSPSGRGNVRFGSGGNIGGQHTGLSGSKAQPGSRQDKKAPLTLRKLKEDSAEEALVTCMHGRFQEGIFVYRQIFAIRSYEIGPDQTATMETILNFLQETALNHVANSGIGGIGFGATRQMSIRKLIWVVTRIQVQVQRYSSW